MNCFFKNTTTFLFFLLILISSACTSSSDLVKEGDVYLFQGKEQIILSFLQEKVDDSILQRTGKMVSFLRTSLPKELSSEDILIEGLTGNAFYDFHLIADNLFFIKPFYKNKTLLYGYFGSLYENFMVQEKQNPFIPLKDFQEIVDKGSINKKQNDELIQATVNYAVDSVYFISLLELLERSQRYFYPQKTREELYQILIYPEIVSFWNYLNFRFGKTMILKIAQEEYTPESFHIAFGEEVGTLESSYVKTIQEESSMQILNNQEIYSKFTNILQLYMSGTKKSLMTE